MSEYSDNHYMTPGSLWHRDEIDNHDDDTSEGKSLKWKTKIVGKTEVRRLRPPVPPERQDLPPLSQLPPVNTEVTILFKSFSNFGNHSIYLWLIVK